MKKIIGFAKKWANVFPLFSKIHSRIIVMAVLAAPYTEVVLRATDHGRAKG